LRSSSPERDGSRPGRGGWSPERSGPKLERLKSETSKSKGSGRIKESKDLEGSKDLAPGSLSTVNRSIGASMLRIMVTSNGTIWRF
jgi:hypothetical protein